MDDNSLVGPDMTKKKHNSDSRELTQPLATAVVASLAMRDIVRMRGSYPDATNEKDAQELYDAIGEHLRDALADSCFDHIRGDLKPDVDLEDESAESELTIICIGVTLLCPNVGVEEDEEASIEAINQAQLECQRLAPASLRELLDQLFAFEICDCGVPEGKPEFGDARRSLHILYAYWRLCRTIVLHQLESYVGLRPHPLLRVIMHLRSRIGTCFDGLVELKDADEAAKAADALMEIVQEGRVDDLSDASEWAHDQLHRVEAFLERARLKMGSKMFPLTHQEHLFVSHARSAIDGYHKQIDEEWERRVREADEHKARRSEDTDKQQSQAYCRTIRREGRSTVTRVQYEEILSRCEDYDMFIDGISGRAICKQCGDEPRASQLTPMERGILIDIILASKPKRPYRTRTGSSCASQSAANRVFEMARKKADVSLGRYEYRAFRTHRHATNRELKSYEFAPPDDLHYCVIVPVGE